MQQESNGRSSLRFGIGYAAWRLLVNGSPTAWLKDGSRWRVLPIGDADDLPFKVRGNRRPEVPGQRRWRRDGEYPGGWERNSTMGALTKVWSVSHLAGFLVAAVTLAATPSLAHDCSRMSDALIRSAIVHESRVAYYRTGHPCACPDDHARNGSLCGRRSAYSRPGGASPKCYPGDVSAADVRAYCLH